MLDLGRGPGQLARASALLARVVAAMDPEPAMQADIEALIRDIAPQGWLAEVIISNALIARRPA